MSDSAKNERFYNPNSIQVLSSVTGFRRDILSRLSNPDIKPFGKASKIFNRKLRQPRAQRVMLLEYKYLRAVNKYTVIDFGAIELAARRDVRE